MRVVYLLGLLGLSACGGIDGAVGEDGTVGEELGTEASSLSPVAELELANGNVIGWYEVFKGAVIVGERFAISDGQTPALRTLNVRDYSAVGLFQALSEGRAVPQQLVDLDSRVAHMAANPDPVPGDAERTAAGRIKREQLADADVRDGARSGLTKDGLGISQQAVVDESACPHSWFFSRDVADCDGGAAQDWIVVRSFRTGTNNFTHDDTHLAWGGACSYRGAIHHRVRYATWYSWSNFVDVTLQTGEGWIWDRNGGALDFDIDVRVDQADGDGFHVCASGYEL